MRKWERPASTFDSSQKHRSILAGLGFQRGGSANRNPKAKGGSNVRVKPAMKLMKGGSSAAALEMKANFLPSTRAFDQINSQSYRSGMYDRPSSQPIVIPIPSAPPSRVTASTSTTGTVPSLASSPSSAAAMDYVWRQSLSSKLN